MSRYLAGGENSPPPSPSRENPVYYSNYNTTLRTRSAASLVLPNGNFVSNLLLRLQWNLYKRTLMGQVFVRFREVSAVERFEVKSSQS